MSEIRSRIKQAGRRARGYFEHAMLSRRESGPKPSWFELACSFVPWWRSFEAEEELTKHSLPWITFPAVSFLRRSLRPYWRVFEFGSGASTVFFALRCREVYAVEHDIVWAEKVQRSLDSLSIVNCRLRHIEAEMKQVSLDLADRLRYRSKCERWAGCSFESYVRSIDDHADRSLDLVVVDGRAREACLRHAISKVSPGGMLVLDNSERARYQAAMSEVPNNWFRLEFPGPCARTEFFTKTTVWIVPEGPLAKESMAQQTKTASGDKGARIRHLLALAFKQRRCPFCGWFGYRFGPFGNKMTYRADAQCPICGSLERHRAVFLLLKDKISPNQKVLHAAPEPLMISWLVSLSCEYLNFDLYNPAMRQMDITQIELPDGCMTLVWCSHVLEHVPNDRKALSEIFRVLTPGGLLVLQVPIRGDTTYEDAAVVSEADRREKFLQEDHVRLYGLDLKGRVEECGFECEILSTLQLPEAEQILYALKTALYREVFVCRKPA